jgi:hypothetical protein
LLPAGPPIIAEIAPVYVIKGTLPLSNRRSIGDKRKPATGVADPLEIKYGGPDETYLELSWKHCSQLELDFRLIRSGLFFQRLELVT